MFPVPDAAHDPPPAATQVHVAPLNEAGNVSLTVAPVTADGPLLDATIVYVTDVPATSVAEPSDFVTARSAETLSESTSFAELFPGLGSLVPPGTATVTVFDNEPVAVALIVAVNV